MKREMGVKARGNGSVVTFVVVADVDADAEIRVVGEGAALGEWRSAEGLAMRRDASPLSSASSSVWTCTMKVPADPVVLLEYKFVALDAGGSEQWEKGPNRRLDKGSYGACVVTYFGDSEVGWKPLVRVPRTPASTNCATWKVVCTDTKPSDRLIVVGSTPELGSWDPERGVTLSTVPSSYPTWFGRTLLGGEAEGKWKLVIKHQDGSSTWETGGDRLLAKHHGGGERSLRCSVFRAHFGDTAEASPAEHVAIEFPDDVAGSWDSCASTTSSTECPPTPALPGRCLLSRERGLSFLSSCSTSLDLLADGDLAIRSDLLTHKVTGPWLWAGAHQIPKVGGRCEDAYFVGKLGLGVADGVGSLAKLSKHGVDPAAYARELMHLAEAFTLQQIWSQGSSGNLLAEEVAADELAAAAMASAEREATTYGAATATVLQLRGSVIGVANLGDSGFMVLRRGGKGLQIVARSKEQQHGWNYPFQLSRLPRSLLQRLAPGTVPDTAADCDRYQVACQHGDLVLLFTDGVIDNLHDFEILEIAEKSTAGCDSLKTDARAGLSNPYALAYDLARAAFETSLNQEAPTPFAVASRRQAKQHYGGKCDDITIAAAWVMPPSAGGRQLS